MTARRPVCVVLALAAVSLLLSGCGDDGGPDPGLAPRELETTTSSLRGGEPPSTSTSPSANADGGDVTDVPTYSDWDGKATWAVDKDKQADARFLIQATFGPTVASLSDAGAKPYIDWIVEQMAVPAGFHRSYYRERVNPRLPGTRAIGAPRKQCEKHSRWSDFAFSKGDVGKQVVLTAAKQLKVDGILRTEMDDGYSNNRLSAPTVCTDELPKNSKTCTAQSWFCRDDPTWVQNSYCRHNCYTKGFGYDGDMCSDGWPSLATGTEKTYQICAVTEAVGGWMLLTEVPGSSCANAYEDPSANGGIAMPNPGIYLSTPPSETSLAFTSSENLPAGAMLLKQEQPVDCELKDKDFIRKGGSTYLYDYRLELLDNLPQQPKSHKGEEVCPVVSKNAFNAHGCEIIETCQPLSKYRGEIELTTESIKAFMTVENRYVYSIAGLVPSASPCGGQSRWKKCDADCGSSAVAEADVADIVALLKEAEDEGDRRDITSQTCQKAKVLAGFYVTVDAVKFKHVHIHEGNVYDFTDWVPQHPGGPAKITKQAWVNAGELTFPSGHGKERWEAGTTHQYLTLLGKKGAKVEFSNLPLHLQTKALASQFSASPISEGWLACGSPGEVANMPSLGHKFSFWTVFEGDTKREVDLSLDDAFAKDQRSQVSKANVWVKKALHGDDQLRQRMAWALSQIFVAGVSSTESNVYNEQWLNYYDIFVRNAFGNFKDILREVTYSPLMGTYLTYTKNSAYDYNQFYPDENYAREIMQLFSIGLWKLGEDGRRLKDGQGRDVPTYSNEHITNFARVMTGFIEQAPRSNIEELRWSVNKIDPMLMNANMHDVYPKIDLDGNHLGDLLPLCSDVPERAFLKQGASYEFIGCGYADPDVLVLDAGSSLGRALGGEDASTCPGSFKKLVVELGADVACSGDECTAETLQVVKVGAGYFKYVPPTCVYLFFFEGKITKEMGKRWTWKASCDNPKTSVAGAWCCKGCTDKASHTWEGKTCPEYKAIQGSNWVTKCNAHDYWKQFQLCELTCFGGGAGYEGDNCTSGALVEDWRCSYPTEMVSYSSAVKKCGASGELAVCTSDKPTDAVAGASCAYDEKRVWTPQDCTVNIRVDADGKVTSQRTATTMLNWFQVTWSDVWPKIGACAASGCEETSNGDACECPTSMERSAVFDAAPTSIEALRAWLHRLRVGALEPAPGAPSSSCGQGCKVFWDGSDAAGSVIAFGDRFYSNAEHLVVVGGGAHKFRNPPAFNLAEKPDERRALAEVEALIDHLFQHPNTPAFIAYKLIQRFVTSNPSPGYVRNVSKAFVSGKYFNKEFSGVRGDLGATIAAILMDPEARGADMGGTVGSLREPLLKLIHFMRAMQYTDRDAPAREIAVKDLIDDIGQWPYQSPTVFNFYHFDYQPRRFDDGLVAPEFEIFTTPIVVSFLNGMMSLIDNGMTSCNNGFGHDGIPCRQGSLGWTPGQKDAEQAVEEMDILLTGGRLNASRAIVVAAYEGGANDAEKLKAAQQTILLTPEFNTLGSSHAAGDRVASDPSTPPAPADYKALVLLFLSGGADTFNLVIPQNANCQLYDDYVTVRQDIALRSHEVLDFEVAGQPCSKFAVHGKLPFLHKLLTTEKKAAFVTNIGAIAEPTTKAAFKADAVERCAGLFSHSDQQTAAMTLKCQTQGASPKGFGGRMADVLNKAGHTTTSFSIAGSKTFTEGFNTTVQVIDRQRGAQKFNKHGDLKQVIGSLTAKKHENIYCEEYAKQLKESMDSSEFLASLFETEELTAIEGFPATTLGAQLHQVSRLIKSRGPRNVARDIFFVELGGFDTHNDNGEVLNAKFAEINGALESFVGELKTQNIFESVTLMSASDFGRTLTSNGVGTDHAWAGNHFVLGGSINGGKLYNRYPTSLLLGNEQDVGKGRLIPQYPWESVFAPIAEWMGVDSKDLPYVFPNRAKFNATHIIAKNTLFR